MPSDARSVAKEFGVADLARLVPLIGSSRTKALDDIVGRAAGMAGPAGDRLGEIDIDHDAAEIEQQRVGAAGRERVSWQRFTYLVNTGTARCRAAERR